mmetsp:Transcript_3593/g.9800  ORF Transcript_3593/g.9800 Transcript_3593/m.9800 type:complete len:241 (+) Transcript_3593:189-911(+)
MVSLLPSVATVRLEPGRRYIPVRLHPIGCAARRTSCRSFRDPEPTGSPLSRSSPRGDCPGQTPQLRTHAAEMVVQDCIQDCPVRDGGAHPRQRRTAPPRPHSRLQSHILPRFLHHARRRGTVSVRRQERDAPCAVDRLLCRASLGVHLRRPAGEFVRGPHTNVQAQCPHHRFPSNQTSSGHLQWRPGRTHCPLPRGHNYQWPCTHSLSHRSFRCGTASPTSGCPLPTWKNIGIMGKHTPS